MTVSPSAQPVPTKKKPILLIIAIAIGSIIFLCIGCTVFSAIGQAVGIIPTLTPEPSQDITALQTAAVQTVMADIGKTATANAPTSTPLPTKTPLSTNTPAPTETPTPLPEPVVLTGNGDNVVDVKKWDGAAIIKITYNGGSNFAIKSYSASNQPMDLLVNTIGSYTGTLPLDFMDDESTARFEVTASGPWEIKILPVEQARHEVVPGTIQASGDEVIILTDNHPDLLKVDASQTTRNFAMWTYGGSGRDLVVNEIGPYTGTVMAEANTFILVVKATGSWKIETTAK